MIPSVSSSALSYIPWLIAADTARQAGQQAGYAGSTARQAGSTDPSDVTAYTWLLSTADDLLLVLALGILVVGGVWWLALSRQNPLISAPARVNTVREDAVAVVVVTYLIAALVISGVVSGLTGGTESVIAGLAIGNGAQVAGIGACLYVGATRFDGGAGVFWWGSRRENRFLFVAYVMGLSVVAIVICPLIQRATGSTILFFVPDYQFQTHPTVLALHDGSQPLPVKVAFWMGAAIVAPVAEELFFRGLLQTFLVSLFRSRWLAIVAASIVFGSVHLQQPSAIPALIVLAVMMGFVYEKTGSLFWPVAIHAAFNLKTLVWDAIGGGVA